MSDPVVGTDVNGLGKIELVTNNNDDDEVVDNDEFSSDSGNDNDNDDSDDTKIVSTVAYTNKAVIFPSTYNQNSGYNHVDEHNDEHDCEHGDESEHQPLVSSMGDWQILKQAWECSFKTAAVIGCVVIVVVIAIVVIVVTGNSGVVNPSGNKLVMEGSNSHRWWAFTLRDNVDKNTRVTIVVDRQKKHVRVDGFNKRLNTAYSVSMDGAVKVGDSILGEQCASMEALSWNDMEQGPSVSVSRRNQWSLSGSTSFSEGDHYPAYYADDFDTKCRPSAVGDTLVFETEGATFERSPTDVVQLRRALAKTFGAGDNTEIESTLARTRVDPRTAAVTLLAKDDESATYLSDTSALQLDSVHMLTSDWECDGTDVSVQRQCERMIDTAWENTDTDNAPLCTAVADFRMAMLLHAETGCRECSSSSSAGCKCWAAAFRLRQFASQIACRELRPCRSVDIIYPCSTINVAVLNEPMWALTRCTGRIWSSCPRLNDRPPSKTSPTLMANTIHIQ